MARDFPSGWKWVTAIVVRQLGPVTYLLQRPNGIYAGDDTSTTSGLSWQNVQTFQQGQIFEGDTPGVSDSEVPVELIKDTVDSCQEKPSESVPTAGPVSS